MKPLFTAQLNLIYKSIFIIGFIIFSGMAYFFINSNEVMPIIAKAIILGIFIFFAILNLLVLGLIPKIVFYPDTFEVINWYGLSKTKYYNQDRSGWYNYIFTDRRGMQKQNFYLIFKNRVQLEVPIQYYAEQKKVVDYLTKDIPFMEDFKKEKISKIYNVRQFIFLLITAVLAYVLIQMLYVGIQLNIHNYTAYAVLVGLIILCLYMGLNRKGFK